MARGPGRPTHGILIRWTHERMRGGAALKPTGSRPRELLDDRPRNATTLPVLEGRSATGREGPGARRSLPRVLFSFRPCTRRTSNHDTIPVTGPGEQPFPAAWPQ